ncbi:hypothetical protein ACVWXO_009544 [Bradyrhizobium sp. LM2.7]
MKLEGLVRRHGTGGVLPRERVADALQLGDAIRWRRRRRRRRWCNDLALELDRPGRMERERHLGSILCSASEERPQDEIGPSQQRGDDGRHEPDRNAQTLSAPRQRLPAPVGRQVAHRLRSDPAQQFIEVALDQLQVRKSAP